MCAFLACGSIPLLSANKLKLNNMKLKAIRIILEDGTEEVFNLQYVRNFSYNEKSKSAAVYIAGDGSDWLLRSFYGNVAELYISNLE